MAAFGVGDPWVAFDAATILVEAYRAQNLELARLRFEVNFGKEICGNCDGLRAGPGVTATCFQIKQCHFDNVREGGQPRHLRVLNSLLDRQKKS